MINRIILLIVLIAPVLMGAMVTNDVIASGRFLAFIRLLGIISLATIVSCSYVGLGGMICRVLRLSTTLRRSEKYIVYLILGAITTVILYYLFADFSGRSLWVIFPPVILGFLLVPKAQILEGLVFLKKIAPSEVELYEQILKFAVVFLLLIVTALCFLPPFSEDALRNLPVIAKDYNIFDNFSFLTIAEMPLFMSLYLPFGVIGLSEASQLLNLYFFLVACLAFNLILKFLGVSRLRYVATLLLALSVNVFAFVFTLQPSSFVLLLMLGVLLWSLRAVKFQKLWSMPAIFLLLTALVIMFFRSEAFSLLLVYLLIAVFAGLEFFLGKFNWAISALKQILIVIVAILMFVRVDSVLFNSKVLLAASYATGQWPFLNFVNRVRDSEARNFFVLSMLMYSHGNEKKNILIFGNDQCAYIRGGCYPDRLTKVALPNWSKLSELERVDQNIVNLLKNRNITHIIYDEAELKEQNRLCKENLKLISSRNICPYQIYQSDLARLKHFLKNHAVIEVYDRARKVYLYRLR